MSRRARATGSRASLASAKQPSWPRCGRPCESTTTNDDDDGGAAAAEVAGRRRRTWWSGHTVEGARAILNKTSGEGVMMKAAVVDSAISRKNNRGSS